MYVTTKIEMRVLEIINPQNTGYNETQKNYCLHDPKMHLTHHVCIWYEF